MALKYRKTTLVLAVALLVIISVVVYVLIPPPPISANTLKQADNIWTKHVLEGTGVYCVSLQDCRPAVTPERADEYSQYIPQGLSGKSELVITADHSGGNYVRMNGGPMDIVEGSVFEYVLYGREVGQFVDDKICCGNNSYVFSHADFYLIKRDTASKQGEVIQEWGNVVNSYGALLYDPLTKEITVELCAVGSYKISVQDDLVSKSEGYGGKNIICRF